MTDDLASLRKSNWIIAHTIAVQSYGLLGKEEVDELRMLAQIKGVDEAIEHVNKRIADGVDEGVFEVLADLSLIELSRDFYNSITRVRVSRRCQWVVDWHVRMERDRARRELRDRIHFWIGVLVELAAVVLAWWLGVNGAGLVPSP